MHHDTGAQHELVSQDTAVHRGGVAYRQWLAAIAALVALSLLAGVAGAAVLEAEWKNGLR